MGIDVPLMDFNKMFAYSKMTILQEDKDRKKHWNDSTLEKKYRFLAFSEFLEYLVRLADYLEPDSEDPLEMKLERLLIKMLNSVGAKFYRNRVLKI